MICTHCLMHAPFTCGLPHAAKAFWSGIARGWRMAMASFAELG